MGRHKKNQPKKSADRRHKGAATTKSVAPARMELNIDKLTAIVDRTSGSLSTDDHGALRAAIGTLAFLTAEIEAKNASIKRLRGLLFGSSTEKTSDVLGESAEHDGPLEEPDEVADTAQQSERVASEPSMEPKPKPKGHGRTKSAALTGAERVCVPHESLKAGELCPACGKGKVYSMKQPKLLVRITGMAPLGARITELERLRCNTCGDIFTAREPANAGVEKYDESAASMIAMFKYGTGVPFYRLEKLQSALGIPLACSTQWDLVDAAADKIVPAYQELVRQAAQGEVLHNDDTTMKILALGGKRRTKAIADGSMDATDRKGIFTTGIVSKGKRSAGSNQIALFFTGTQHAGQNLADVLAKRASELARPIQMCDALSHNTAGDLDSTLAHCLAHARRRFVEVVDAFPGECAVVLDALRQVYRNDAKAERDGLSPEERQKFHRKVSRPQMVSLKRWLRRQIREHLTEPNSGLGQAIAYTLKHWVELTLFLREPGAPLDNNVCERALKRVILHRKNAYFYMSKNGARVGDLYMSLIYTAELCGTSPFDYLNALQVHHDALARDPSKWMPWNYAATHAGVGTAKRVNVD